MKCVIEKMEIAVKNVIKTFKEDTKKWEDEWKQSLEWNKKLYKVKIVVEKIPSKPIKRSER